MIDEICLHGEPSDFRQVLIQKMKEIEKAKNHEDCLTLYNKAGIGFNFVLARECDQYLNDEYRFFKNLFLGDHNTSSESGSDQASREICNLPSLIEEEDVQPEI